MNTVCCWLPLDHPGVPSIRPAQTSVTPKGRGDLRGQESPRARREQRHGGILQRCQHKGKASLWVKPTVRWNAGHLAADGCSILDLAIPLEKTPSVMVLSALFSNHTSCSDTTRVCKQELKSQHLKRRAVICFSF